VKGYLVLRSKVVHDPVRVVIERQLCPRYDFVTFGRLEKGLVCVAAAGDENAGPRSRISGAVLGRNRERGDTRKRHQIKQEVSRDSISSDRQLQFEASFHCSICCYRMWSATCLPISRRTDRGSRCRDGSWGCGTSRWERAGCRQEGRIPSSRWES